MSASGLPRGPCSWFRFWCTCDGTGDHGRCFGGVMRDLGSVARQGPARSGLGEPWCESL